MCDSYLQLSSDAYHCTSIITRVYFLYLSQKYEVEFANNSAISKLFIGVFSIEIGCWTVLKKTLSQLQINSKKLQVLIDLNKVQRTTIDVAILIVLVMKNFVDEILLNCCLS